MGCGCGGKNRLNNGSTDRTSTRTQQIRVRKSLHRPGGEQQTNSGGDAK